jgi:hypothetical protein
MLDKIRIKSKKPADFEEIEYECIKRLSKDICNEVDRMIIADLLKESKTVQIKTYWDES